MIFRIYYKAEAGHTHMRLFAGRHEMDLRTRGDLIMHNEEFAAFREIMPGVEFWAEINLDG